VTSVLSVVLVRLSLGKYYLVIPTDPGCGDEH